MLKTEKPRMVSSVNVYDRSLFSGYKIRWHSRQEGSILIGLIITMVVMAFLGAGMVYLTTTSTFQELMANNHTRAYYAAESGGRYASALARQALATGTPVSIGDLPTDYFSNKYTMLNGDEFQITNWDATGASLVITFDSTGTVGSGFLKAQRKLSYRINPANQMGAGPPGYTGETDFPTPVSDFDNITTPELINYFNPAVPDDTQIKLVKDDPKTGTDPALNLVSPYYTTGLSWYTEANKSIFPQLDNIRTYNDNLLSYNIQIKLTQNDTPANDGVFMSGIAFRLDDSNTTNYTFGNMYGIAVFAIDKNLAENKWPDWYKEPASSVWSDPGIGIRKLDSVDCSTPANSRCDWYNLVNATNYVVLFKRVGSTTNNGFYGKHTLLAYTKLSNMSGVLDGVNLRDWTTLMVKVTEEKGGTGDLYGYSSADIRYNTIKCFLQIPTDYPRRIGSTPEAKDAVSLIKWEDNDFIPIDWEWVASSVQKGKEPDGTTLINNMIVDTSLNTLNYNTYNSSTTTKAREIGLFVYYRSEAANQIYFDNFYIDLSPSTDGGEGYIDGSGYTEVGG